MDQPSFSEAEYRNKKRKTRRELFLERMDALIPWEQLEQKIACYYPRGHTGGPRIRCRRCCESTACSSIYNLSDPAMEDALYEIECMRRFAGLRLTERLPDEITILNFRHFLEQHGLGERLFKAVNKHRGRHDYRRPQFYQKQNGRARSRDVSNP